MDEKKKGLTYAEAGVDIDAGEREVELIKKSVQATYTRGVLGDLGGFGGLFRLKDELYDVPPFQWQDAVSSLHRPCLKQGWDLQTIRLWRPVPPERRIV